MRKFLLVLIAFMAIGGCGSSAPPGGSGPGAVDDGLPVELDGGQLLVADNELGQVIIKNVQEYRAHLTMEERVIFDELQACLNAEYQVPLCNPPEPEVYIADIVLCGASTAATACTYTQGQGIVLEPHTLDSDLALIHELAHVIQWACTGVADGGHCAEYWANTCGDYFIFAAIKQCN